MIMSWHLFLTSIFIFLHFKEILIQVYYIGMNLFREITNYAPSDMISTHSAVLLLPIYKLHPAALLPQLLVVVVAAAFLCYT
jgi:hypothetical protein